MTFFMGIGETLFHHVLAFSGQFSPSFSLLGAIKSINVRLRPRTYEKSNFIAV